MVAAVHPSFFQPAHDMRYFRNAGVLDFDMITEAECTEAVVLAADKNFTPSEFCVAATLPTTVTTTTAGETNGTTTVDDVDAASKAEPWGQLAAGTISGRCDAILLAVLANGDASKSCSRMCSMPSELNTVGKTHMNGFGTLQKLPGIQASPAN
eukprot:6399906-Amphidinium_carterae.1